MKNWYNIQNVSNTNTLEVNILDEIGLWGITSKEFIEDLNANLNKNKGLNTINVNINSPGGDVFSGLGIYNYLKNSKLTVNTNVLGLAASIASVILMAGDNISANENSLIMIHQSWASSMGNSDDLRETADLLDKVDNIITNVYQNKTNLDMDFIKELMSKETWLDANQAKLFNFIDNITEEKIAASITKFSNKFKNIPNNQTSFKDQIQNAKRLKDVEKAIVDNSLISNKLATVIVSKIKSICDGTKDDVYLKDFNKQLDSFSNLINSIEEY